MTKNQMDIVRQIMEACWARDEKKAELLLETLLLVVTMENKIK